MPGYLCHSSDLSYIAHQTGYTQFNEPWYHLPALFLQPDLWRFLVSSHSKLKAELMRSGTTSTAIPFAGPLGWPTDDPSVLAIALLAVMVMIMILITLMIMMMMGTQFGVDRALAPPIGRQVPTRISTSCTTIISTVDRVSTLVQAPPTRLKAVSLGKAGGQVEGGSSVEWVTQAIPRTAICKHSLATEPADREVLFSSTRS